MSFFSRLSPLRAATNIPRRLLATMSQAPLDASKLLITKTTTPKEKLPNDQLVFGKTFSDHMLEIEWTAENGWAAPTITPYHTLNFDPSTIVFHYGFEAFEGMKAYRDKNNQIRIFRPNKNMDRLNASADRICLPTFDGEQFIKLIEEFVKVDQDFVPQGEGYSLYLRPTIIGTSATLGVSTPDKALLYLIASPVGPYYSTGFKAVSLEATDYAVRAWPGGVGNRKLGANYAPCVKPALEAAKRGYQQNLWLFGEEGYITEVGTMNVFFVFQDALGKKELATAPLDGTILEGVTRDSVLALARAKLPTSEWTVSERKFTMKEVKERAAKGELVEAFGSGTAALVSPIKNIGWKGEDISVPLAAGDAGELTVQMAEWIKKIQYGEEEFEGWSRIIQ
ncbi:branched-chain amino acid aminotransferase [Metschnikowia aff. pulcherrima]|uniref:Branched-chain-amino-acid aminotransferase n=2 Tax=Metschnikowia TaxID=27320 RepID=A0A4P6XKN5_9ASCO|nr:branched-chain amino acid aminotransferase [Metschnikowia aff. pulcherrima]